MEEKFEKVCYDLVHYRQVTPDSMIELRDLKWLYSTILKCNNGGAVERQKHKNFTLIQNIFGLDEKERNIIVCAALEVKRAMNLMGDFQGIIKTVTPYTIKISQASQRYEERIRIA